MDIRHELLREHSKAQTARIVKYIGSDKDRFAGLMNCVLKGEYLLAQRASWVMSNVVEKFPGLIHPYLKHVIENLDRHVHDAVRRNTLRALQFIELPGSLFGIAAERCFQLLGSRNEPVAIKVFAMTVLHHIAQKEPDLKNELRLLIEEQMPYGSAGFKSRGNRILKAL